MSDRNEILFRLNCVSQGEYVGGALQWEDLILYATEAGFTQPRLVTAKPIAITNEEILKAVGKIGVFCLLFSIQLFIFCSSRKNEICLSNISLFQITI